MLKLDPRVEDALRSALKWCLLSPLGSRGIAATYIEAWLDGTVWCTTPARIADAESMQALYVLGNLGGWKGPEARVAKATLKLVANGKIVSK